MNLQDDRMTHEAGPRSFPGFHEFYAAAFPVVLGRVILAVGQRDLAEDLAQDAMVEMMRQWGGRGEHSVDANVAWTVGIAVNLARRHRRRYAARSRALSRLAGQPQPGPVHVEMEVLARDETYRRLARLPRQQRAVAVLWAFADMSAEDIAQFLGISPSTVRTHLQRVRQQIAPPTAAGQGPPPPSISAAPLPMESSLPVAPRTHRPLLLDQPQPALPGEVQP